MGRSKVSILLPSLNARKFLDSRVDSLLKQTFVDWEAIILDSQSTDGSWEFFNLVAQTDSRFRLYRIPREGVYTALNRGLELVTGEFLHIAPCDDTMAPEFLAEMIEAFGHWPDAGVAVCDCLFINQDGHELLARDTIGQLSRRRIKRLLRSGNVRSSIPAVRQRNVNYRPPPHDCLLHFTGRSVYFSLTQLLIRTAVAKATGPFETSVGSVADFGWLVRLTSLTASVHMPKKLATWRFHGEQLSMRRDDSRVTAMSKMCRTILPEIRRRYPRLLSSNDCELLLLPYKTILAKSAFRLVGCWLEALARLCRMLAAHPLATLRALCRTGFRAGIGRNFPVAIIFQRERLLPRDLKSLG
jgi:glycosyltransferase involved in cell wall biosynthesis